jgi:hypothetical protein
MQCPREKQKPPLIAVFFSSHQLGGGFNPPEKY